MMLYHGLVVHVGFNLLKLTLRFLVVMVALACIVNQALTQHGHWDVSSNASTDSPNAGLALRRLHHKCDENNVPPINLKQLYDPFVGRESNMIYLEQKLLTGSVHVLGINGPPGFGKSTLAIHLGWKMVHNCFTVGYIDLHEQKEIIVRAYRQLAQWEARMEQTSESLNARASSILKWFVCW